MNYLHNVPESERGTFSSIADFFFPGKRDLQKQPVIAEHAGAEVAQKCRDDVAAVIEKVPLAPLHEADKLFAKARTLVTGGNGIENRASSVPRGRVAQFKALLHTALRLYTTAKNKEGITGGQLNL